MNLQRKRNFCLWFWLHLKVIFSIFPKINALAELAISCLRFWSTISSVLATYSLPSRTHFLPSGTHGNTRCPGVKGELLPPGVRNFLIWSRDYFFYRYKFTFIIAMLYHRNGVHVAKPLIDWFICSICRIVGTLISQSVSGISKTCFHLNKNHLCLPCLPPICQLLSDQIPYIENRRKHLMPMVTASESHIFNLFFDDRLLVISGQLEVEGNRNKGEI